ILLAIAFTAILGASARNVIIALSIVYVPGVARVVRSAALVVKNAAFIHKSWWMVVFPGFMIIVSVLSLAMLGDGLRDFLDPRTRDAAK
ncbi:MAG: hypothetical protein LBF80_07105, partial [Spirochaetaceae bacterium]|nr:hypothetical protein [Spirochaetaceae bacterium]